MNIFNIIGPVMIGPSSSHTAGAVRLGRIAYQIMGDRTLKEATIQLSGSFARTYQGHGTDRALLAGLMGYESDSEEIRDALHIAEDRGIKYTFVETNFPETHPNTAKILFTCDDYSTGSLMGASVGGGNIRVNEVNGMKVSITGENHTLLVLHRDVPGVIADVTNFMRRKYADLNIGSFVLSRVKQGGEAIMSIEFDGTPPDDLEENIMRLKDVTQAVMIPAF